MTCDWCRSGSVVHIPDVGAWCSWHAVSLLQTWPSQRLIELEVQAEHQMSRRSSRFDRAA